MGLRGNWAIIGVALWGGAVAHAAAFTTTIGGLGQDYAAAVASDGRGNTYVAGLTFSKDFPVTAGAVQTTFGGTSDAFVAKLGPDGKAIWATFLGGILDDGATGIGLDGQGNVIVSGWTRSQDFPTAHAIQGTLNGGAAPPAFDAFVAKIDPSGPKLLYSTFLGGPDDDFGYGLAVDGAGNAYLAGTTTNSNSPGIFVKKLDSQGRLAYSFFRPSGSAAAIAVDEAGSAYVTGTAPGSPQKALVFKLAADGSRAVYETTLGGALGANGMAIAVGRDGSAYVGGLTASVDFPLVHPLQSDLGARPLWKSTDGGATWVPLDHLPFAFAQLLVETPGALYAGTWDAGVQKSVDGGVNWAAISHGIADISVPALSADPRHQGTLYAGTGGLPGTLYKTVDGGANWSVVDSMANSAVTQIVVDGLNSDVYAIWNGVARKSSDGGATWHALALPNGGIQSVALDPNASGSVFAASTPVIAPPFGGPGSIWHSADGGATWTMTTAGATVLGLGVLVDASTKPSVIYNAFASRSNDGGATWAALPQSPVFGAAAAAVAVDASGTLYGSAIRGGIYVSHDRGQTWSAVGSLGPNVTAIVPTTGALFALIGRSQTAGFVMRLGPGGNSLMFSTFLGGHVSTAPVTDFPAEPAQMLAQNGVFGLALDHEGNVVVAGVTRAADFPLTGGPTCANAGAADAFVATIAGDGSRLLSMECTGGTQDDGALAVATDRRGGVVAAGQTWSPELPGYVGFGDALVVRLGGTREPVRSRLRFAIP
jgi:photosystem II stability/assembly factor-like uncharacterized protein